MTELSQLQALGLTLPSPAYLAGAILFGIIGLVAFSAGRRKALPRVKWIGVALMFYPYLIPITWLMYLVGLALCGALYWAHRKGAAPTRSSGD